MDGKKPQKADGVLTTVSPVMMTTKEGLKNIIPLQLSVLDTGKGWVLGSRLPSAPPMFFRGKRPGNEIGIGLCQSSWQFDLLFRS